MMNDYRNKMQISGNSSAFKSNFIIIKIILITIQKFYYNIYTSTMHYFIVFNKTHVHNCSKNYVG